MYIKLLVLVTLLNSCALRGDNEERGPWSRPEELGTIQGAPGRLIRLVGGIGRNGLDTANSISNLVNVDSRLPIDILINSPGGSILTGTAIISAIEMAKSRGIVVRCIVPFLAASMAFSILHHCSERYALPTATLLFHPARIANLGEPLTQFNAAEIAEHLREIDIDLVVDLKSMGMDEEMLIDAFVSERLWMAAELAANTKPGYLIILRDIEGIDDLFLLEKQAQEF